MWESKIGWAYEFEVDLTILRITGKLSSWMNEMLLVCVRMLVWRSSLDSPDMGRIVSINIIAITVLRPTQLENAIEKWLVCDELDDLFATGLNVII